MKNIVALFFLVFLTFGNITGVVAAELLMIHHPLCSFCKAFHRDIGVEKYNASKRGKALPLRVIDVTVHNDFYWFNTVRRAGRINHVQGTPTFIIYHNDREVGRVVGYSGEASFYKRLDAEVKRTFKELSK